MNKTIIHIDMDAFFASIEIRDNPSLAEKPLIVGSLPGERGVVSTCDYKARKYGVHSAMSITEAYRRCPNANFVRPDMEKYSKVSSDMHKILSDYTDIIEFVALDEGYLDVTGSLLLFKSAENIALEIKRRIKEELNLTCSVGIGYSMMTAKLASEEKKPDGFFKIQSAKELQSLIIDRPVSVIPGIGKQTEEKLLKRGIKTVRDILSLPPSVLTFLGKHGMQIHKLAHGIDERTVEPNSKAKSVGNERTFMEDITDIEILRDMLMLLSREVSTRLGFSDLKGKTITLKIKYSNFKSITRAETVAYTNDFTVIFATASKILSNIPLEIPVRLIGVTVSDFENETSQISLDFGENSDIKSSKINNTILDLNKRFGNGIIKTAAEIKAENHLNENHIKIKKYHK